VELHVLSQRAAPQRPLETTVDFGALLG